MLYMSGVHYVCLASMLNFLLQIGNFVTPHIYIYKIILWHFDGVQVQSFVATLKS